jgi:hypothetical protein
MTWQQLQDMAAAQASAAIAGQNAPLTAQVGTLADQEARARQAISGMGGQLLPYVQYSAQDVQAAQNEALQQEQQIFAAAGTRMNQLHQQQANEAQTLAQQMGGPVSTGDFTSTLAPYETVMPEMQGSSMLHALGSAMTDTAEAQKFAGQVFPALITEQEAKSDSYFNDQIKTLQDQITKNSASKSDLVNKNLNDLLDKERTFELNIKQQKLDQLKTKRDWKIAQDEMAARHLSENLSKQAAKRADIGVAQRQQTINLEQKRLSVQQQMEAQRLGLSKAEFYARLQHQQQAAKVTQARESASVGKDALSVLQAAMGSNKPISMTHRAYIPGAKGPSALTPHPGAAYDPVKKQWYKVVHETMTAQDWSKTMGRGVMGGQTSISDPNRLFQIVRGTYPSLGRQRTIKLIQAQVPGAQSWQPGKKISYNGAELHRMTLPELVGVARDHGYKGNTGKSFRQSMTDYILGIIPNPNPTPVPYQPGVNP